MSPRSDEMMAIARERLRAAPAVLAISPGAALSLAYYAMMNAARAALSERDTYAKTHSGLWNRFWQVIVEEQGFDRELATAARDLQEKREDADYNAWPAPEADAREAIELATRFLAAIDAMFP